MKFLKKLDFDNDSDFDSAHTHACAHGETCGEKGVPLASLAFL